VDRDGLARLVASISRFLDPAQAIAAGHAGEIEVLDSRRFGGAWVLHQLWERLGVGAALHQVAADRRIDGGAAERVLFALVAQRALAPGSKLAATRWVAERVAIADCPGFSDDCAYAAMDFLLDALGEIAAEIFDAVAHLLRHRLRRPPPPTGRSTVLTSWPTCSPNRGPMRGSARRSRARLVGSASPRTTATTCPRW